MLSIESILHEALVSDSQSHRRPRVWFVNDDVTLAEQAYRVLQGDFDVALFLNAADAMRAMNDQTFEAILSDYAMPKMGGIEVLRRARTECPGAARVLISDVRISSLRMHLASRLIDAFFLKPLRFEEIRTRIFALQRRPHRIQRRPPQF